MAVQTMAEHLSEFRRMHENLPGLRPAGVARTEAGARFCPQSLESGRSVSFTFQVDDEDRIARLEVEAGPNSAAAGDAPHVRFPNCSRNGPN